MVAELIVAVDLNGELRRTGGVAVSMLGFRTSPHTISCDGSVKLYQTPFNVVKQGRLMRSLTAYIMCSDHLVFQNVSAWSWCVWVFASPSDKSYYLCLCIRLPLCLIWRQTRTQLNNICAEFRRAVPKHNKLAGITTCGFLIQCGELCMIIFLSPLQSNYTFFLYSPTILLEKQLSSYQLVLLSSKSELNQNQARHKISNLTSSRNSKLGEILISVVRFHLVHSCVQVPTWWWSKSSFGLIGTKGICIDFIDSGALLGQYQ